MRPELRSHAITLPPLSWCVLIVSSSFSSCENATCATPKSCSDNLQRGSVSG